MKLKEILAGLEGLKVRGDLEIEINNLDKDSRKIDKGSLFIAIKGFDTDGHEYIQSAIEQGATAVMIQEGTDVELIKKLP